MKTVAEIRKLLNELIEVTSSPVYMLGIEILEHLSHKTGTETKINFLKWNNKNAINEVNPNIELLKNIIKVQTGQAKKIAWIREERQTTADQRRELPPIPLAAPVMTATFIFPSFQSMCFY